MVNAEASPARAVSSATTEGEEFRAVHRIIRDRAERYPDRPAIRDHDGSRLGYGALVRRWRGLAAALRAAGAGPDRPVAVRIDRSADVIVSMMAILEAGAAYAPIDGSCPPARFAAIAGSLGARILVTDEDVPAEVAELGLEVLRPGEVAEPFGDDVPLAPDNLAYVLHTSGSTGVPKGVAMTHRGLARLIRWQVDDGPPGLRTLNFTPMGFDVTFQEVLSTLATGGLLCVVPEPGRRDPDLLLAMLGEQKIERIFLPYVALQQLAVSARRAPETPLALRHVITAGERLVITDAIRQLFARLPGCRLDNHYGPTEAHLVTSFTLRGDPATWDRLPAIGTAVSGADLYLLDEDLEPVPVGEEGELVVGGAAVSRGYLNAPAQTAGRFLPDPFAPEPGARMYRTGDLARMDSAGVLHFVGRADTQVKIRGYRVEPAEVEIVLAGDPRVREVAVGTRMIAEGVPALVAYLVADGERPSVTELGERVRRVLPDYMAPSRFVVLDALPKTASGKVDHQNLSTVDVPAVPEAAGSRDSLPGLVSAVWQRVLGHDEFDGDDDFFDVGGDSVLAAWAMTELGQSLGRELGLSLLLTESTVNGLAGLLASERSERPGPAVVQPRSEIFTLRAGPSNRALFLFHALGGELSCYRQFAREMRAPLRVLGVRWAGDPGGRGLTVGELAAVHVERIRTVQPDGPYLLAGWSFGGVLAFEAARQLVAEGSAVEFVGLLDANPLRDPITGRPPKDTGYLSLLEKVLDDLERREVADEEPVDAAEFADEAAWARLMGATPAGLPVRHVRRYLALARDNMRAAIGYEPRCYPGDVDLFQAAAVAPEAQRDLAADLRRVVAGEVRITPAPGDHAGMLIGPQAGALASLVDEALERSRKAGK